MTPSGLVKILPAVEKICGFSILRASLQEVYEFLLKALSQSSSPGFWLLTLNLEMLARAARDPSYQKTLAQSDFAIADGMPVVWASRFKKGIHEPIPERSTGVDLVEKLLRSRIQVPFAVIGGANPRLALEKLGVPLSENVFVLDGEIGKPDQVSQILEPLIEQKGLRLVLIALGVPRQDELAAYLRKKYPHLVLLTVGGSFDLLAGMKPRAPQVLQNMGLEWSFRLVTEPGRLWKRYLLGYPRGAWTLFRDTFFEEQNLYDRTDQ